MYNNLLKGEKTLYAEQSGHSSFFFEESVILLCDPGIRYLFLLQNTLALVLGFPCLLSNYSKVWSPVF
jgi:hypothetical protein